jgi:serine/threonine protein kinase
MLDLFKNIINKKSKDQSESCDLNVNSNISSSSYDSQNSINLLLKIHPELSDYYTELHTRYLLSDKIGEGAFSSVYKAYDSKESRYLAIKIINKSNMKPDQINSTLKEIAIMRQLNHPNIVKLYSYQNSSNSKYCFLFLEYVAGGEIFNQIIKYTYFSENLTRHILRQIAFAVKYLHDNGIVHRDIKPENLLFEPSPLIERTKDEQLKARRISDDNNKVDEGIFSIENGSGGIGMVKLADFGLSTLLQSSNQLARTPCGTVGYTSPEQHMNVGYDKKVDMWAIGCVLYTMVVGFPPFYSNTQDTNDITEKVMKGEYQFLKPWFDEVSDGCKNLISNLLTVDPIKRYSIDQLLLDPWFNQGYENENENSKSTKKLSLPAADAPKSTFDNDLYKTFSEDLINTSNVDDYFSGHKITCDEGPILTPRAEAIKLVFDTAKDVQKTSNISARSISPQLPNTNRQMGVIDFMCLNVPARKYSTNSNSLSDLDSEKSYNYSDNDHSLQRFSNPITIHVENKKNKIDRNLSNNDNKEKYGNDNEDDDNDNDNDNDNDDDYDDDSSLDSEYDEDNTDDYPITLTSLAKTRSPMIRKQTIESSNSLCVSPSPSHDTTATLTTQTSTRVPSIKSLKSLSNIDINHDNNENEGITVDVLPVFNTDNCNNNNNNNNTINNNTINNNAINNNCVTTRSRKTSISFSIDVEHGKRSGSITSNSSHRSNLSNSSVSSTASNLSNQMLKLNFDNDLNKVDEAEEANDKDDGDDSNNDTTNCTDDEEWEDRTPLAKGILHKMSHREFRAKCQTHTPFVGKIQIEENRYSVLTDSGSYTPPNELLNDEKNVSLEEKMMEHSVTDLKINSSTILSRRKQKVEEV